MLTIALSVLSWHLQQRSLPLLLIYFLYLCVKSFWLTKEDQAVKLDFYIDSSGFIQ